MNPFKSIMAGLCLVAMACQPMDRGHALVTYDDLVGAYTANYKALVKVTAKEATFFKG